MSVNGKEAKLEYRQVSPNQKIAVLNCDDMNAHDRGYAQGYLMGDQLWDLLYQILPLMMKEAGKDRKDPKLEKLHRNAENFTFPSDVEEEHRGLIEGFQKWAAEKGFKLKSDKLLSKIKMAHVLTDTYKAIGSGHALPGCSTAIFYNEQQKPILGTNLDWISIGKLGRRFFIKEYSVTDQNGETRKVFFHTFPGLVGGLRCWNDKGLKIIVNELGQITKNTGTPYNLMVKELLESCSTVEQVKAKLIEWQKNEKTQCASSISLNVADEEDGSLFQFYVHDDDTKQKTSSTHITKIAPGLTEQAHDKSADFVLMTTNHAYDSNGKVIADSVCDMTSECRLEKMKAVKKESSANTSELMEKMLMSTGDTAM